jgi:hypothetical protein
MGDKIRVAGDSGPGQFIEDAKRDVDGTPLRLQRNGWCHKILLKAPPLSSETYMVGTDFFFF